MTHDEMIEVIQAHKDGKVIQRRSRGALSDTFKNRIRTDHTMDFFRNEFRIKPMPKEYWLVPYKNKLGFTVFGSSTKNLDSDWYNDKLDFDNTIHVVTVVKDE
jgi:hypothetical protein